MALYALRYTTEGDTLRQDGTWNRVPGSACLAAPDEAHLERLVKSYTENLERTYSGRSLKIIGVFPINTGYY